MKTQVKIYSAMMNGADQNWQRLYSLSYKVKKLKKERIATFWRLLKMGSEPVWWIEGAESTIMLQQPRSRRPLSASS